MICSSRSEMNKGLRTENRDFHENLRSDCPFTEMINGKPGNKNDEQRRARRSRRWRGLHCGEGEEGQEGNRQSQSSICIIEWWGEVVLRC